MHFGFPFRFVFLISLTSLSFISNFATAGDVCRVLTEDHVSIEVARESLGTRIYIRSLDHNAVRLQTDILAQSGLEIQGLIQESSSFYVNQRRWDVKHLCMISKAQEEMQRVESQSGRLNDFALVLDQLRSEKSEWRKYMTLRAISFLPKRLSFTAEQFLEVYSLFKNQVYGVFVLLQSARFTSMQEVWRLVSAGTENQLKLSDQVWFNLVRETNRSSLGIVYLLDMVRLIEDESMRVDALEFIPRERLTLDMKQVILSTFKNPEGRFQAGKIFGLNLFQEQMKIPLKLEPLPMISTRTQGMSSEQIAMILNGLAPNEGAMLDALRILVRDLHPEAREAVRREPHWILYSFQIDALRSVAQMIIFGN